MADNQVPARFEDRKLTQAQSDNLAMWGGQYSQFWFSESEHFDMEFNSAGGDCGGTDDANKKFWAAGTGRSCTIQYIKVKSVFDFAQAIVDRLVEEFELANVAPTEITRRWNNYFVAERTCIERSRNIGEDETRPHAVIFNEDYLLKGKEKYGIKGVYGAAMLAFAKLASGKTGPAFKTWTPEMHETIKAAGEILPFEQALEELVKPIDRMVWNV